MSSKWAECSVRAHRRIRSESDYKTTLPVKKKCYSQWENMNLNTVCPALKKKWPFFGEHDDVQLWQWNAVIFLFFNISDPCTLKTHNLSSFQPMSSMLIRSPHLNLIQLFSQAPLLKWKWRHLQSVLWISWARRGSSVIHGSIRLAPHTKVPAKALTKGC